MISWTTLCIDAEHNGRLAGEWVKQAQWDLEAAQVLRMVKFSMRDGEIPEEVAASYLSSIWSHAGREPYRSAEKFKALKPEPGVPLRERLRRQLAACFMQVADGYLPTPLSPCESIASLRQEIRLAQLADAHPEFSAHYRSKLAIPEPIKTNQP